MWKAQKRFEKETEPVIKNFHSWLDHHKNYPSVFKKFLLRDILHYSDKEVRELSMVDYTYATHYALETYLRRDVAHVMNQVYGTKKKTPSGKKEKTIKIEHPDIKEYIQESYEGETIK